ncbi:MAG: hypothetical protein KF830_18130 [Planctomycetes bacterium]|nr:hypothetical protein [Planctomycetota bacterium]
MIVVTGMHRSGTSLVCQLLHAAGLSFGETADHLPADRWNPAGYFEAKAVVDANSRIVTGLPRCRSRLAAWGSRLAYLRLPRGAAVAARAERERDAIAALGRQHAAGAVKDPRFCLTLRWWLQWAPVRQVVVCLRPPAAVLASLRRRDHLPLGFAARFYAYHVDALLPQLPGGRTRFVDVDRLVAGHAAELDALRQGLGLAGGPASASLLREGVRTDGFGAAAAASGACPPLAAAAWLRLRALAAAWQPVATAGEGG